MKSNKRILFLLAPIVAVVTIYLPYRFGHLTPAGPQIQKIITKLKQLDGTSEIREIQIVEQTDDSVTIGVNIFYNGEHGDRARTNAQAVSAVDGFEYAYARTSVPAKKGDNYNEYKIIRPHLATEELLVNKIRVNLYGRTRNMDAPPALSKELSTQIIWPSKFSEEDTGSYDFWRIHAQRTYSESEYYRLHRMFEDWNNPQLRLEDGKWRLSALESIGEFISIYDSWDYNYQRLSQWREELPGSEGRAIIEAVYWIQYAWKARGTGYANDVTKTGWQLYKERLQKAEKTLLESKEYAADNPLWYQVYIQTAMGLGWDKARLLELVSEAVARHPHNYETYFKAAYALSPKWGGSYQLMDAVAQAGSKHNTQPESDVIYARVYWSISGALSERDDFFKDTLVSWPRMKTGFYQILNDYPESDWNLNHFGKFACDAGDRETYLDIRKKMGDNRIIDNLWTGNSSLEVCDRTLMAGV